MQGLIAREQALAVWRELGEVTITDDALTTVTFRDFPVGTPLEEIWQWFEETYDTTVYDLLYKEDA